MERAFELGPVVRLLVGPVGLLVISDPEAARSLLIADAQRWRRTPATTIASRLALGENLFTQGLRSWSRLQPALAPDFRKRALQPRLSEMGALVDGEIESVPLEEPLDLDQLTGRIAMMVASFVLFGQHLSRDRADELADAQRLIVDWVGRRIGSPASVVPLAVGRSARIVRRHRTVLHSYADEVIARRRAENDPPADVLQALLEVRPGGRPLRHTQLRSQVLGLFGAGNETTAATLGWAMVLGATHPREWAALRTDATTIEPYISETLRLRPQAWGIGRSPRRTTEYVVADGHRYRVRPYQATVINVWGMNRDPKRWPNPESFEPSRHRELTRDQDRVSFPFGLGPRGCIGQQLAMAEMASVLPALARRGDVGIEGPAVPDPVFTLRVRSGLRGYFTQPVPEKSFVGS